MKGIIKSLFFLLMISLVSPDATGQQDIQQQILIETLLGEYLNDFTEESSKAEFIDYLINLKNNPINLNYCSKSDLRKLPFLTEYHINNFFHYRYKYGKLLSIYELQTIEGFDKELIEKLLVFCDLNGHSKTFTPKSFNRHQIIMKTERTLQKKEGYKRDGEKPSKYAGNPGKIYLRYDYSRNNNLNLGFTLEKDPGEELHFDPQNKRYLFDYSSFFVSVKGKGIVNKLILGDYRIQSGQGLVFGSNFSFGKSSDAVSVSKNYQSGIRAYQSSYEQKSFSGIGASLRSGNFKANIILSQVFRDATLKGEENKYYIESLRSSGYHRTVNELKYRKNIKERSIGVNIAFSDAKEKFNVGVNYLYSHFSIPFRKRKSPEFFYDFSGKNNHLASIYADYSLKKTHVYGEIGKNLGNGFGGIIGLTHHIYGSIFFTSLYRYYSKGFKSFHGNSFAENSSNRNEKGIYFGFRFSPIKHLNMEFYLDKYEHPWLKYGIDRPSSGNDFLLKLNYSKYKVFDAYLIHRSGIESEGEDLGNSTFQKTISTIKNRQIFDLKIYPVPNLVLQQRVQRSTYDDSDRISQGYLLSTSLSYKMTRTSLHFTFSSFDSDDNDNRQYIYLRTVPYSYAMSSFNGKGSNINLFIQYDLLENLSLNVSFNQSHYPFTDTIGNGDEMISVNKKTVFRMLLLFQFQ